MDHDTLIVWRLGVEFQRIEVLCFMIQLIQSINDEAYARR